MKKSLLALAVLGAFAGAAQAQTNVSLFGVVDTGILITDDGDEKLNELASGGNAASRWGIKGTEDLGSGLKASFVLEAGFDSDSGSGSGGFSRLSYIGLGGGFGEVRLGRQNTVLKELMGDIDTFGAAGLANAHDFFLYGMDQRQANLVTYLTPKFGGFSGQVQYGFGEERGENSANRQWGAVLGYGNGPLNVQLGYRNKNASGEITADDVADGVELGSDQALLPGVAVGAPVGIDSDTKDVVLGATYNFGVAKLHAAYGQRKIDGVDGVIDDVKIRSGLIGVTVPFGASAIRAQYIKNQERDLDADLDNDVFALSYSYALSKRTAFYATYVRASNDDDGVMGLGGGDYEPSEAGDNVTGFMVGVSHKF